MTRTSSLVDGMASQPRSAAQALAAAVADLRERQDPQGWWKGDLDTNVTMDAEDLLLREFLHIRTAGETEEAARWIRSQQRDDGSWAVYYGGPGELSTTVEAWVALRLAGDPSDAPHLVRAAEFVRAHGGLERTRVFTRIWLAMFGLWSWDDLPHLPPELIFFPKWFPFNVYDWGCWARQTIVPLTIVCTLRPVRSLPFGVDELRTGSPALRPEAAPAPPWTWAGLFQRTDRVLHAYSRRPVRLLRRAAMRRAAEWILA
ncbi:MAG: squalene--hopene cyclase, partial [Pseudonocardiaceae bacterium]